jgi:predicted CoA-substrate-specific enzyme activase
MITAGIDIGIEFTKVIILKDKQVLAREATPSGGFNRAKAAEQAWQKALSQARLTALDVTKVVATGQGKWDVPQAKDHIVETMAEIKAALWLFPQARSIIGSGADQARAVRFDAKGQLQEYVLNQKCAAGLGLFLESEARMLGLTVEEMGKLSAKSNGISINDQCGAYAGLDTVSLIHNNVAKAGLVQAIHEAVATRLSSMVNETSLEKEVVFLGGVARNSGVVKALKTRIGIEFVVPEYPEYAAALGAAIIAAG